MEYQEIIISKTSSYSKPTCYYLYIYYLCIFIFVTKL